MEAGAIPRTQPLLLLIIPSTPTKYNFPISLPNYSSSSIFTLSATPRGFGYVASKKRTKKSSKKKLPFRDEDEDENEDDYEQGVVPEMVTNRMIRRMGFTVGIPLTVGLLFFPFFYYLKVGAKVDVPNWVPFIVSFIFFGTALLGVTYGIVSSSWDPLREGSLLGWNEAQRNWPVFLQSFWTGGSKKQ